MLKKLVVLFACLGLVAQLSGCTSRDSKEDGEAMAIDSASADSAEVEKVEGGESLDITADDSASSLSSDALPEDALGEAPPAPAEEPMATVDSGSNTATSEVASSEPPPVDLPADTLGESSLPSESVVESTPSSSDSSTSVMAESSAVASSVATHDDVKKEAKPVVSYKKVETTPWKEGGKTLNTVYVARDGDNWKSVSQMVYGTEKASDLKKMNPSIKSRKLRTGDKVYYNSPHRPDDETKVLTYYEDSGMAPEVYIAKSGDNLKHVAKELFGNEQAWKELYATNDFESKTNLDEGTQIKYWRSAPATPATTEVASAPAPTEPNSEMPPPPPTADMPPPPPSAGEMAPPPPPPTDMAMNEVAPPPPPPVEAVAPPPPPPPPAMAPPKAAQADHAAGALDEDQTQMLAAGAIVFVGLALFIMLRRKRRKELEQAIQDTQVG